MPPDPQGAMLSRYLTLHPFPPSFSAVPALPTDRFVRPLPFDRSGSEALPDWVDGLPRRPTVYATLGTAFNDLPGLFGAFVAGLGDAPLNLIVTVGRDGDPAGSARCRPTPGWSATSPSPCCSPAATWC